MCDAPYREIPLYGRRGIVGRTMVDSANYEALNRHRWGRDSRGYARRYAWIDGRRYVVFMAREVMELKRDDRRQVDHINRNPLDNRSVNLRIVTKAQNRQNLPAHKGSVSRFRGVYWEKDRRRWRARIAINGVRYNSARFEGELDAALAAEALRREHMPFAEPDPELAALRLRRASTS